jgi:S1-C subfamily serine protease
MIIRKKEDSIEVLGTGFICHSKGYIISCAHTINLTDELGIITPSDINSFNPMTQERANFIPVTIAQYDAQNDVALLKLPENTPLHVPTNIFGNPSAQEIGTSIACLGYPFSHFGQHTLKITSGIVSSKVINKEGTKQFQIDSMIHECNSGGPLIDLQTGKIIGVVSGRFSPAGNGGGLMMGGYQIGSESSIGLATTINYALELIKAEGLNV